MQSETLNGLLQHADLEIVEFSIQHRSQMQILNRVLPYYIMSYIKNGEASLRINDKIYQTGAGNIIIVPPNVPHDHYKTTTGNTTFMWWHFNFKIAGMVDAIKILDLPLVSSLEDQEEFEKVFTHYVDLRQQADTLPKLLKIRAFALEIMSVILDNLLSEKSITERQQIPANFLSIFQDVTDLDNEKITLRDLSAKYHMNTTYISNRFKYYFDVSPIALRRNLILQKAKYLLRTKNDCIGDIAYQLGFEDICSFSRFFSKHTGVSPIQFRQTGKV